MRIVLDTNVLVSALLKPNSNPAYVLRLILQREIELVLDERILDEYEDVLARPKFRLDRRGRAEVIRDLNAIAIVAGLPPRPVRLPDPNDQPFLEAAMAAQADAIVTGNTRHFPDESRGSIRIIAPTDLVQLWSELNS